jgi:CheY-like chemotaxis protein
MVSRSSEPPRIVVVDDDPQIRDVIGRCLFEVGASVTLCEDAFAALEAIKKVRPDLVLADLVMPGRYGLDLLYQIRSWGQSTAAMCRPLSLPAYVIPIWRARSAKVGSATWPSRLHRSNYSTRSFKLWVCYLQQSERWSHPLCSLTRLRRFLFRPSNMRLRLLS